jgi:hypothetical protein
MTGKAPWLVLGLGIAIAAAMGQLHRLRLEVERLERHERELVDRLEELRRAQAPRREPESGAPGGAAPVAFPAAVDWEGAVPPRDS